MKLLIDDTTGRTHNLNANEACVYAAILKCTKAGRGWFANYRDLADALPFVISRMTVSRSVEKLLNLGLIERRDNSLFACAQIEQIGAQIEQGNAQNEQIGAQIEQTPDSPYNPLIINNDMERENIATCAQTCDTRKPQTPSFIVPGFLDLTYEYQQKGGDHIVKGAVLDLAQEAWRKCSPAKKIKLLAAVKSGAHFKSRLDWLIADFPEPTPDFLRGDEGGDIVQVRYNGAYKLCTRATMELFGLEWVRDW